MGESLDDALAAWAPGAGDPGLEPDVETLWVLLFTSGTSAAPKAVRCTQRRLLTTGNRMTMVLDVGPDDVGYLAMPLFHSNSLMVGLAPALVAGASVGLARRFSASRFLEDVRRYGATWFNYTGKPLAYLLATPERPDDADNPLRLAYGNEGSPHVVEAVAKRFGVAVVDVFGSTEGGIALDRSGGVPRGSVGKLRQGIKVVDPDGNERPRAVFDADGRLVNAEECVGEIVNVEGRGPVRGLLPQRRGHGPDHPQRLVLERRPRLRRRRRTGCTSPGAPRTGSGWTARTSRPRPIEAIVARHPDVMLASVYGVPDVDSGDQVMAALVLRDGATLRPRRLRRLGRRPERPEPQVASPLRAGVPGAAHHAHQQGPRAHTRAPEVPRPTASGGTRCSCGVGARTATGRSEPTRSRRCARAFVDSGRAQAWDL